MLSPILSAPKKATAKDIWRAISELLLVMYRSNKAAFLGACLLLLLVPIPAALGVSVTNNLVEAISIKDRAGSTFWALAFVGAYIAIYTLGFIRSRNNVKLIIFALHEFERRAIEHLGRLSMAVIEHPEFRKLHGQYSREFYTIRTILQTTQGLLGSSLKVLGWGSVLLLVPKSTALLSLVGLCVYAFVAYKSFKTEAEIQEIKSGTVLRADYFRTRLQLVTLQASLRTNQITKPFIDSWDKISTSVRHELLKRRLIVRNYNFVADLFEPLSLGVGLLSLLPSYFNGTIEASVAITFIALYPRLWDNMINVMTNVSDLSGSIPFILTYNTFHAIPEETAGTKHIPNKPLNVVFDDVSFKYPGNENWVLEHVSFSFNQGDELALIGLNGAGKSTLLKLLVGLYHPTSGRILINGTDIKEADPEQWRKHLSYMDQSVPHYDDTLKEQIHYGDYTKPLDKKRLHVALHASGFDEIAGEFSRGLDTHAGRQYATKEEHPVELSGGQNQILTIARTIYRPAKLYIFDEPTSAVDAIKEEQFFNRLPSALEGKTILFISHRFSTVRRAKRIIVLSGGTIVEDGSHAELMDKGGLYHELFTLQAKAYSQ